MNQREDLDGFQTLASRRRETKSLIRGLCHLPQGDDMQVSGVRAATILLALMAALAPESPRAEDITIVEKSLPGDGQRPQAIVVGPNGNLWVTEVIKHQIFRIKPNGDVTAFRVPGEKVGVLQGITFGPDGNLWFTSREENAIRRVSPAGEFNGTFVIPSQATEPTQTNKGSWPRGITVGPDGQIWFAEMAANKIGRVTLTGEFSEFEIPTAKAQAYGVVTGPDQNLWFTESGAGKIGRLEVKTGKITEFALSNPQSRPRDIAVGPDGHLWFSMNGSDHIGRISTDGDIKEFPLPADTKPIGIAAGADGNVWFTAFKSNKIGRISPTGVVSFFDLKTANAQPFGMTTGPNGAIWFTLQANHVGHVNGSAKRPQ
jgi:virginiamycin B lyase